MWGMVRGIRESMTVVDPKKKKFVNRLLGFFQTSENIYVMHDTAKGPEDLMRRLDSTLKEARHVVQLLDAALLVRATAGDGAGERFALASSAVEGEEEKEEIKPSIRYCNK